MIGKLIKNSFKVVGSAGLLLVAGASKITATVLDQNGGNGDTLDGLGDSCMDTIRGMWDMGSKCTEESEHDRSRAKEIRLRQGIDRYKRLRKDAEIKCNAQLVNECNKKIQELEEELSAQIGSNY